MYHRKSSPSLGVLAAPRDGGVISSRHLTPHALHAAHAVTGAVCVASACTLKGSVSDGLAQMPGGDIRTVWIEHPSGKIDVRLEASGSGPSFKVERAGVLRTADHARRCPCPENGLSGHALASQTASRIGGIAGSKVAGEE
jgi:4-oxalomesaconate tautomerase